MKVSGFYFEFSDGPWRARGGQGLSFSSQIMELGSGREQAVRFAIQSQHSLHCPMLMSICPSIHPPTHSSLHPSICAFVFRTNSYYSVILQERKEGRAPLERSHTHVSGQFYRKSSFLPIMQLGELQPCPPSASAASPSFPLLTGLRPALCTYGQGPTIRGTFFLLSALLLIHQIGRTPGCLSGVGSMAEKHQCEGTEFRGEYPIGTNVPTDVHARIHSHIHPFFPSFLPSFNK